MKSFKDGVLALALALMALTLAGCGSDSKGGSPAPAPQPSPESPADFVSQSVEGTVEGSESINGSKSTPSPPEPFALYIDADKMNIHVESHGSATVKHGSENITAKAVLRAIVNTMQKKVTYMMNITEKGKNISMHQSNCSYIIVAAMPDKDAIRTLISSFLKSQTVTKAADGNKQIVISVDPSIVAPNEKGTVDATVELGDDNVLHKVITKVSITEPVKTEGSGTLTATKFSAGAPDASKFVVDSSWGHCTKGTPPSLYEDLDSFSPHISTLLKLVFQTMQIKPEIETQSELIAI